MHWLMLFVQIDAMSHTSALNLVARSYTRVP